MSGPVRKIAAWVSVSQGMLIDSAVVGVNLDVHLFGMTWQEAIVHQAERTGHVVADPVRWPYFVPFPRLHRLAARLAPLYVALVNRSRRRAT